MFPLFPLVYDLLILLWRRALPQHVDDLPLAVILGEVEIIGSPLRDQFRRRGLILYVEYGDLLRSVGRQFSILVPRFGNVNKGVEAHLTGCVAGFAPLLPKAN